MNYSDIKIPFVDKDKIKRKADLFREKFWDDSIPVDIDRIIDLKLETDIIPLPDLGDAFISSDYAEVSDTFSILQILPLALIVAWLE